MGRRGAVRRVRRISGQPRSLALHRRHAGGEAAERGGVITAASHSAAIAIAEQRILPEWRILPSPPSILLVFPASKVGPNATLESVDIDARSRKLLGQLLCRHAYSG